MHRDGRYRPFRLVPSRPPPRPNSWPDAGETAEQGGLFPAIWRLRSRHRENRGSFRGPASSAAEPGMIEMLLAGQRMPEARVAAAGQPDRGAGGRDVG